MLGTFEPGHEPCFYLEDENKRTANTKYPLIKVMCSLIVWCGRVEQKRCMAVTAIQARTNK